MKSKRTLVLAASILMLTLAAFPRHASAAADGFLWFHSYPSSSTSTILYIAASVLHL
ncbi:MAG TPA: hypothetical protein VG267_06455 [Terracidiphilus sp.]|jgi:hypothetical protein|nr:hypothetical protein [Terracidiphilus sp.]